MSSFAPFQKPKPPPTGGNDFWGQPHTAPKTPERSPWTPGASTGATQTFAPPVQPVQTAAAKANPPQLTPEGKVAAAGRSGDTPAENVGAQLGVQNDIKAQEEYDNSFQGKADALWTEMLAGHDASLGGKMNQTYADEAGAGRRMAEMNAGMGRGVSGGFAGGMGQVALGGMQQRQDVMSQHEQQGLTMKAAYLDKLIKQAEASNDRELQEQLEAERNATQLAIAGSGLDTTQYNEDPDMNGVPNIQGETVAPIPDTYGQGYSAEAGGQQKDYYGLAGDQLANYERLRNRAGG